MICVRVQKGSGDLGLQQTEVPVKLITRFEPASRSTSELYALHRDTLNAFCRCRPHSADQPTCLASLANLEAEISSRTPRCRGERRSRPSAPAPSGVHLSPVLPRFHLQMLHARFQRRKSTNWIPHLHLADINHYPGRTRRTRPIPPYLRAQG